MTARALLLQGARSTTGKRRRARRAHARLSRSVIQDRSIGARPQVADPAERDAYLEPLWGAIRLPCDALCPREMGPVR